MLQEQSYTLYAGKSWLCLTPNGELTFSLDGQCLWQNSQSFCMVHYYDRQHPRAMTANVPSDNSQAFGTAGTPSLTTKSVLSLELRK